MGVGWFGCECEYWVSVAVGSANGVDAGLSNPLPFPKHVSEGCAEVCHLRVRRGWVRAGFPHFVRSRDSLRTYITALFTSEVAVGAFPKAECTPTPARGRVLSELTYLPFGLTPKSPSSPLVVFVIWWPLLTGRGPLGRLRPMFEDQPAGAAERPRR